MTTELYDYEQQAIANLLIGRKVVKVEEDMLRLSGGVYLKFKGNEGCGGCASGWYDLTELNDVDNIITNVEFDYQPTDDYSDDYSDGYYRIFVFADNQKVNLVTFEGTDGNGYYGSGYSILVRQPGERWED